MLTSNEKLEYLVDRYSDTILRLSFSYLKNMHDAQDVCQTVFVKLITTDNTFADTEHEKAYILRVTANTCKDILRSAWRNRTCTLEHCADIVSPNMDDESSLLWAVGQLDTKYRTVIHLHYYEGYKAHEIAKIMSVPTATIHTRLIRGRERLKKILGGEDYGYTPV